MTIDKENLKVDFMGKVTSICNAIFLTINGVAKEMEEGIQPIQVNLRGRMNAIIVHDSGANFIWVINNSAK